MNYRYGYQGSEKDDEITGIGQSHFTTFYREGDTRLGRWWSVDPKTQLTPWESPYAYMGNNPIEFNDKNGDFLGTLVGAVVGGAVGAYNAYKNKTSIKSGVAEGVVSGAIAGAIVDITVATYGTATVPVIALISASAVGGALGGGGGDMAGKFVNNLEKGQGVKQAYSNTKADNGTVGKVLSGAATGAISGVGGVVVGKILKPVEEATKGTLKTMSGNITSTSKTLYEMGASPNIVQTATNKITTGMGAAGKASAENITKVEVMTATAIESAVENADNTISDKITQKVNSLTTPASSTPKPAPPKTKNEPY